MAVAQLFTFEDFPGVIAQMDLPGGEAFASIYAAFIVTVEIAALPFLLSMRLSPAARIVSMIAGWVAIAGWLFLSLWVNAVQPSTVDSGLLGATVSITAGWWEVFFSLALTVLAAWVAWGIWPLERKRKS